MEPGGDDIRVQLTRIEGGVALLNERHENVKTDIREIREQQHRHSNRIGVLEADKHLREGERKGFITSGRLAWGAVTVSLSGGAMALVRMLMS